MPLGCYGRRVRRSRRRSGLVSPPSDPRRSAALGSSRQRRDQTYLQRELAAAFARTLTPDCSIERCTYCGACDFTSVRNVTFHPHGAKGSESRGDERRRVGQCRRCRRQSTGRPATGSDSRTAGAPRRAIRRAWRGPRPSDAELSRAESASRGATDAAPVPAARGYSRGKETPRSGSAPNATASNRPATDVGATGDSAIRLVYQKLDRARFLGNRELTTAFVRACRRAGLPLAFSRGHHPMPRMSFGPALSVGFASHGEYLDSISRRRGTAERCWRP